MSAAPGEGSLVSSTNTEENEFYDASSYRQSSESASLYLPASGVTTMDEEQEEIDENIYVQDDRKRGPLQLRQERSHHHDPTFRPNSMDFIQTKNRYNRRSNNDECKREETEHYDNTNLSVSGSVKHKEQGAAAADAMFRSFWPIQNNKRRHSSNDILNESSNQLFGSTSNDFRSSNHTALPHGDNDNDEMMLYSPTASNASSLRRRGGSMSQRGRPRRRRDFQRQRRETKSALLENLPWRMEIMAILLAILAGLFVLGIMIGLVLILLTSGTRFRPKYGV